MTPPGPGPVEAEAVHWVLPVGARHQHSLEVYYIVRSRGLMVHDNSGVESRQALCVRAASVSGSWG